MPGKFRTHSARPGYNIRRAAVGEVEESNMDNLPVEHDDITDDITNEQMAPYEAIRAEQEANPPPFENRSEEWTIHT